MSIQLAADLEMDPSQAATQTLGAIASKGKGKSYLASKFFEQLIKNQCPGIVLDPVGNWHAIKLDRDGVSPGLAVPVIGGIHGDVALDDSRGFDIAKFLIESNGSAILDVSELSGRRLGVFGADFCEGLFRTARLHVAPRMIIFEEAQVFAPQSKERGDERMVGAVKKLVRLGRNYGLGSMMVTQRPQSVSKEVLNMIECLFVGGMQGPHERKAIAGWVTEQGVDLSKMLEDLPKLNAGEFFCWSPSWLKVAKKIRVLPKDTFDGSSTPTLTSGGKKVARKLAAVDVEALRALLAGDEVRSEDSPEISRTLIEISAHKRDELEAERNAAWSRADEADAEIGRLNEALDLARDRVAGLHEQARNVVAGLSLIQVSLSRPRFEAPSDLEAADAAESKPVAPKPPLMLKSQAELDAAYGVGFARMPRAPSGPIPIVGRPPKASGSATSYRAELLAVIALHGPVDRMQISILSGKSKGSSTFREALATLEAEKLIQRDADGFTATHKGKAAAPKITLPKGRALFDYWCGKLDTYAADLFKVISRSVRGLNRADLAMGAGKSAGSSTFRDAIGTLKRLGLITSTGKLLHLTRNARESMGL